MEESEPLITRLERKLHPSDCRGDIAYAFFTPEYVKGNVNEAYLTIVIGPNTDYLVPFSKVHFLSYGDPTAINPETGGFSFYKPRIRMADPCTHGMTLIGNGDFSTAIRI